MRRTIIALILTLLSWKAFSQKDVIVKVDVSSKPERISPYIFGKNNSLSDNPSDPLTEAEWQRLRDLGVRMFRENGGNNASKYNWRRKLSSHPDWYNNVYAHSWDFAALSLQQNIPQAQGMWGFQLGGKAAKTTAKNFNDWSYNGAQWWSGCSQNLAGGGTVNPAGGSHALVEGNPDLYLENWNADSTTGILTHWFGTGGIGLDPARIQYWNMDNEPEIWEGTHDDIWPVQPTAEEFLQRYFDVAKKTRALYPDIKLMGPIPANEWQWFNYKGGKILYQGKEYVWLEYFIKRVAEEQKASGIRLLDVLDIHFYPGEKNNGDIVQLHRVYFDETYSYPGANGIHRLGSNISKEYIFKRCSDWLNQYMGAGHGVSFSVSETGVESTDPNVTASWYASTLGEFAKRGVELFTPWSWKVGMDEVLHLFSRYSLPYYLNGISSGEQFVSAYPTTNYNRDSLVIFFVNRHLTETRNVQLDLTEFPLKDGTYKVLTLSGLPASESFISHSSNALKSLSISVKNNMLSLPMQPLSVSAIILKRNEPVHTIYGDLLDEVEAETGTLSGVTVGSSGTGYSGTGYVTGFDNAGDRVSVVVNVPSADFYKIVIRYRSASGNKFQDFSVNYGDVSSVPFPLSNVFAYTIAGNYLLNKGSNTLSITKSWGWTDIDKFEVYPADTYTFDIDTSLVDTAANQHTRDLYRFLQLQFGERIISGQTESYFSNVTSLTGKTPMLKAGDLSSYTEGYPYAWKNGAHAFGLVDDGTVSRLISWYKSTGKKGIVALQWHWCSPSGGTPGVNTFYTDYTTFDITRAVTPGTAEYTLVIRDIDTIAYQLKRFQSAGVPILWRPLHEAGGGWFWWGAKTADACKALYAMMFDRMQNYHKLHNLIWVWSTPETDWYPGNEMVDIIGHDSYPGSYNYGNQKNMFDRLTQLTDGKKLIAMTENGPIPDPDQCLNLEAPWLYFMSWSDLVLQQNDNQHIKDVFGHPEVLTIESDNARTSYDWRSSLYPENWKPGFKDSEGRFLQDFSCAGYHKGEEELPVIEKNIIDVTRPPYLADNTGEEDVTSILQQAINNAGIAGGGVVYLPAGLYRIQISPGESAALHIAHDSVVLRGAGPGSTYLLHTGTTMRQKNVIEVSGEYAGWFAPVGVPVTITADLAALAKIIPVSSVSGFKRGDLVVLTSTPTDEFIAEHKMTGVWDSASIKGVAFLRRIEHVDSANRLIILDAPIRYFLKKRDDARMYHAGKHLRKVGIENLSVGNVQHTGIGWDEEDYEVTGTGAYDVHRSQLIVFRHCEDSWLRNVHTFKPEQNSEDFHMLSNGVLIDQCRQVTIDSCVFEKSQYEGGGGNGYMYTLQSNDCIIMNSRANHGRHNFDFKYPFCNGNVIHRSRGENSKYASDFHMYLSMANLFDNCTFSGDYLESAFRPYGNALHGYTSTQSVFYNTAGEAYHPDKNYLIESRQLGWGYVIGTSGPAPEVLTDPVQGISDGYYYNTAPEDFTEGIGMGASLQPVSLYLDQLDRRMSDTIEFSKFNVKIIVKDQETGELLPGAAVTIYNDTKICDENGSTEFQDVIEVFVLRAGKDLYQPVDEIQYAITSDTTLYVSLSRKTFSVTVKLVDAVTHAPFWGASVSLGNVNMVTNTSGEAIFSAKSGINPFSVNKVSYKPESGDFFVQQDTIFVFYLIRTHADAKFRLKEGIAPIDNARIILDGDTLLTNSLGIATFKLLKLDTLFTFEISKPGYLPAQGEFSLQADTLINLVLVYTNIAGSAIMGNDECIVWPNPAGEFLFVRLKPEWIGSAYHITDVAGKVIFLGKFTRVDSSILLGNLTRGNYLLQLLLDERTLSTGFVKN
ncbi:MAG: glycosyl hydrolase [Bacteroidales bacterium]